MRKSLALVVLVAALFFLLAGATQSHKVYDRDAQVTGLLTFHRIRDPQLVIDSTFGGVIRKGDRLYSTYDRGEKRGKRSCPS